ncbi:unnamed protein product [Brassica oleracea]
MSKPTFTPLIKLRLYKTQLARVKCFLHSWKQKTLLGGDSFEMDTKIHATCKQTLMYRVQRDLPTGELGVIENVSLTLACGQYRTTKHKYKMAIRVCSGGRMMAVSYASEHSFNSLDEQHFLFEHSFT